MNAQIYFLFGNNNTTGILEQTVEEQFPAERTDYGNVTSLRSGDSSVARLPGYPAAEPGI
jgi:hypothetical protein